MKQSLAMLALFLLGGCGLEVAGTAAVGGAVKAQEAQQAQHTKERVQQRLDAAMQNAAQRTAETDKAAEQ